MNLGDWEALLKRELKAAKFILKDANPALGWSVFRRLLQEPLQDDAGAFALGRVERDYRNGESYHELQFGRHAESDIADSRIVILSLEVRPAGALAGQEFEVFQRDEDSEEFLGLDEFLDRAYAEPRFQAALAHPGKWKAQLFQDDVSD